MKFAIAVAGLLVAGLPLLAAAETGGVPDPYVAIVSQAEEPVSVYATPGGTGHPLTACFGQGGHHTVDGTIIIQLLDAGEPVAGFPAEDIWLEGGWTSLPDVPFQPCPSCGSCADAPTDQNGITTFSGVLSGSGTGVDPEGRNLVVYVAGEVPPQDPLDGYRVTTPDFNGDQVVDLVDLARFSAAFGTDNAACDFNWDGHVGLEDLLLFSVAYGEACPQDPVR